MSEKYDFIIIGGGIVGLSTAMQLQSSYKKKKILLLEKEKQLEEKRIPGLRSSTSSSSVSFNNIDVSKYTEKELKELCDKYYG